MSLSITQIKTKVTPKLRGTTLARVPDFYGKCREAAGNVLSRCYPLETIRSSRLDGAIYSHVYNYVINQDIRGNKGVIDIRPISERSQQDDLEGRFGREFDIKKDEDTFTIEIVNGIKTLRLSKQINGQATLSHFDTLTGTETVTASGDVTNLEIDRYDYVSGNSSLKFSLSGATGAGTIEVALAQSINLETIEDIGALFNWLNFPDITRLNSMTVRWGSDSSNYWSKSVTTPHDRTAFESNAWTLQRYDWVSATETGSPDATTIDYVAVVFDYDTGAAISNVRLDAITAALGRPYEVVYYSNRFFKSTAGTYLETPTDDSDTLNIAVEGENIFLYELMLILIQELGQKAVAQNAKTFQEQLYAPNGIGLYDLYNRNYPSQAISKSMTYYNF